MPNALSDTMPPVPNPQPQDQSQPGGPGQAAAANPAPSHAQTVAALRHFQAINTQLEGLLKNPDLGKTNIKSSIIDAVTKLVADRIISPGQAVIQLGNVPDRPFEQKAMLGKMFAQNMQAEIGVLDHHRAATPGTGIWPVESALHVSEPDRHMETMGGMMSQHYGGGRA
jgi:hypothetical protein